MAEISIALELLARPRVNRGSPQAAFVIVRATKLLRVSEVEWDGERLRFRLFAPSAQWTVDNEALDAARTTMSAGSSAP
jgi:hypothetical protein